MPPLSKGGGPPSDQRDDGGGRIPSWVQSTSPAHTDRKSDPGSIPALSYWEALSQSVRDRKRISATLILSAISNAVLRSESSSQGYRLSAASLPAPFNKGAEPTLCADGRFVRSQDDLRFLGTMRTPWDSLPHYTHIIKKRQALSCLPFNIRR